jgi:hypothetical protein
LLDKWRSCVIYLLLLTYSHALISNHSFLLVSVSSKFWDFFGRVCLLFRFIDSNTCISVWKGLFSIYFDKLSDIVYLSIAWQVIQQLIKLSILDTLLLLSIKARHTCFAHDLTVSNAWWFTVMIFVYSFNGRVIYFALDIDFMHVGNYD